MEVFLQADSNMSTKYKLILDAVVGTIKPPSLPQAPSSNSPLVNTAAHDKTLKNLNAFASIDYGAPTIDNVDVKV